ncbi:glycosyltransferase [Cellulomonas endometrii]|uniref:glycosyltransferase n=1 Tax=Cellulomonas endometrii TaxID=3036301 RepID=UPI0024ADC08E|nr:glycosyltransferase [Cellulomonas endometrii]
MRDQPGQPALVALVCPQGRPGRWAQSIASLRAAGLPVVVLTPGADDETGTVAAGAAIDPRPLAEVCKELAAGGVEAVLVVTSPVLVPQGATEPGLALAREDIRTATVSFLSNDAGYLSFPGRSDPRPDVVEGHDEHSLTAALRAVEGGERVVPVPVPAGAAVLVPTVALRALGGLDPMSPRPDVAVTDLALRGVARGFRNLVDPTTFLARYRADGEPPDAGEDEGVRAWLARRHPFHPVLHDQERYAPDTPVSDALALREAAVLGLRILFDGSCLGPHEMGTQVATLAQIQALARHPRVREVVVGTPGGAVPTYATSALLQPGVRTTDVGDAVGFPGAGRADVVHRPFQPDGELPFERWRELAHRTVITIQDLIAYDNGSYFPTHYNWLFYRHSMQEAARRADATIVISHDTERAVRQSRLGVAAGALHVVANGTDHLAAAESRPRPPVELVERGVAADRFLLVLGASYAHKNRDLAIRAWHELRARGHDLQLVLAGFEVPVGSSSEHEALAVARGPWPIVLADVATEERDWLLEHAAVVLYPTSAEGFGLIPFEAATFGSPSVFIGFGPLDEVLPDVPVAAREWTAAAVADAVDTLVSDPRAAREQVEAVQRAGKAYTWRRYADRLVDVYLQTLTRPARR